MPTRPLSIGILAFASAVIGAGAFAFDPGQYDPTGAVVVLGGIIIVGLTGLVGLMLARAPWGRWVLVGTVVVGLVLASVPGSWGFWMASALGAISIVGLVGPWLQLWIRHEPAADAPGPVVVALVSVAPAAPLFIGIVSLWGFHPSQLVLIMVAMVSSWAYARGVPGGIWGFRLALPVTATAAVAFTAGPGRFVLGIVAGVTTIAAWMPQARQATAVITPPLPEPVNQPRRSDTNATD